MSTVEEILQSVDWRTYEENVVSALQEAVKRYAKQYTELHTAKISQVAIWTDPQSHDTAINFETQQYAQEQNRRQAQRWRDRGEEEFAVETEAEGLQGNPADFKYREFLLIHHAELAALAALDFADPTQERAALTCIQDALLRVKQRVQDDHLLADLPREEQVWFGVNSPDDWYDHVTLIT